VPGVEEHLLTWASPSGAARGELAGTDAALVGLPGASAGTVAGILAGQREPAPSVP
jgi:hypothetical protein